MKFIQFLFRCFIPGLVLFSIITCFTTFDWQYEYIGTIRGNKYSVYNGINRNGEKYIRYSFDYKDENGYLWHSKDDDDFVFVLSLNHWEKKIISNIEEGIVIKRKITNWWLLPISFFLLVMFGPCFYEGNYIKSPWSWLYRIDGYDTNFKDIIPIYSENIIIKICKFTGHYEDPKTDRWGDKYWILKNGRMTENFIEFLKDKINN